MVNIYTRWCGYFNCLCLQLLFAGIMLLLCPVTVFSHSSVNSSLINKDASGKLDAFSLSFSASIDPVSSQELCNGAQSLALLFPDFSAPISHYVHFLDDLSATVTNTHVSCYGSNDGSISITDASGGTATYVFSIDGGASWQGSNIFYGLEPGTYDVRIKDSDDFELVLDSDLEITEPPVLTATVNKLDITCFGADDGTITVSDPIGGYSTWEVSINGTDWFELTVATSYEFTGLAPDTYSVQIRDAANTACVVILGNQTISEPPVLSATVNKTDITCNGADDGAITVSNPQGGYGTYEYRINDGEWQISGSFNNLTPATYSVQIRDAANVACVITLGDQTITEPPVLSATVNKTDITCNGADDGTITISNPQSGYGTYEYRINDGEWQVSGSFNNLTPATYSVQIRDAANPACVITLNASLEITQPDVLAATIAFANVSCIWVNDGTITITEAAGGSGSYEYSIDGGSNWQGSGSFTSLSPSVYNVKIRDATLAACLVTLDPSLEIVVTPDTEDPEINCPGNQDVEMDANLCTYTHSGTDWDATATDNCEVVSIEYELTSATSRTGTSLNGVTFNPGETTVTWTATDSSGNESTCSYLVIVVDRQRPVINCIGDQTIPMDEGDCTYMHSGTDWDAIATDNCGISNISYELSDATTGTGSSLDGVLFQAGITLVTWTATDTSGNTAECSFTVTVTDNEQPVISGCPDDFTVYTGPGRPTCNQIAAWTEPTATDNCTPQANITPTRSHAPGSTFPVGTTQVTYTFTDAAGNASQCIFNVTVIDNTPPNFTDPDDITIYTNSSCTYNASPSVTGNVSGITDNCPAPTGGFVAISSDVVADGPCDGTYDITRTWSVTDAHGNTTTKEQIIRVRDNLAPALTVPSNRTIQCHESTDPSNTGQATATDACGGPVDISYSDTTTPGTCVSNYDISRTWTATDCSGNVSSGVQIIQVRDNIAPTIVSIDHMTVQCPTDIPDPDISVITATDNCGSVSIVFIQEFAFGLEDQAGYCPDRLERVYRVTDQCGNYTDAIQIIDILEKCDCEACDGTRSFFTVDLIDQPYGTHTEEDVRRQDICCDAERPWSCVSFNIRIDPGAVGIQITVIGATPAPMEWSIDCDKVELIGGNIVCIPGGDFHLFTFCQPGGNLNTYIFESIAGIVTEEEIKTRVSCNTEISVEGNITDPVWNSVYPGTEGQYNHYLDVTDPFAPIFFPDENAPPELHYQVCGNLPETPCVEDQYGCKIVVIYVLDSIYVEFDQDPGAYCQDDIPEITATVYPGGTTYTYEWFDGPDATGNLVESTATYKPPAAGDYSIRVRDVQEGVLCSELIYNFLVAPDDTPPVITPPDDLVLECNDPTNLQQIQDWLSLVTAVDDHTENLDIYDDYNGITEFCNSEVIVTFWAEDDCKNRGEATALIRIIDTKPPVLDEAPEPIIIGPDPVTCDVDVENVNLIPPLFTDQCDDDASLPITHNAPATFSPGETLFTWTATDACGNIATVIQSVTVFDPNPPLVDCPPDVTVPSAVDSCGAFVTVPPPNVTDPCPYTVTNDSPYRTSDTDASGFYPIGTTVVTWTITGISGNVALCVQEVTVTDLDPWVTCPDPIEVPADYGLPYNDAVVTPAPGFGDNCPDPVLSWTMTPPEYFAEEYLAGDLSGTGNHPSPARFYIGVSTITYTVTDSHDNTATCFFTITITSAPIIDCPADIIMDADAGECFTSLNPDIPTLVQGAQPIDWTWTLTNPDGTVINGSSTSTNLTLPEHIVPTPPHEYDFQVGTTTILWTATNMSGVDECTQTITVIDDQPPTFTPPDPFTECVDLLFGAVYTDSNPNPNIGIDPNLILNPSPDYYTFFSGNTALDITEIFDNCCEPEDMTIYWHIDFTDTPDPLNPTGDLLSHASIDGTGQPSAYGSNMLFHGDGVNFTNVTHTITYWIVDCNGQVSAEQTQTIVITHRPQINKM